MTFTAADAAEWVRQWPVTRGFGDMSLPQFGRHTGCDLAVPEGAPVLALRDGVVDLDDDDASYDPARWQTWSGIAVRYQLPAGGSILCAHLASNLVAAGDAIHAGDVIGFCGGTGAATGPHLHLEVRDASGQLVDPLIYFAQEDDMAALTEQQIREIAKDECRAVLSNEAWLKDAIRNAVTIAVGLTLTKIANAVQKALADPSLS